MTEVCTLWMIYSQLKHRRLRAKLHYTDTGYEHQLRTPPTNTTNGQKFATSQHLDMSRCWALALRCGKFVIELLWACPLVVSVAGVRSRCPCSGVWLLQQFIILRLTTIFQLHPRCATYTFSCVISFPISPLTALSTTASNCVNERKLPKCSANQIKSRRPKSGGHD